jgi:CheW-like domain
MAALDDNIKKQLSGKTLQVVSFALGSEEYGVDIAQVQEINRMVTVTHVPQAAQFMEGVINLRGRLIPIIDLRTRFGMERAERTKNTRIVVTEIGSKRLGRSLTRSPKSCGSPSNKSKTRRTLLRALIANTSEAWASWTTGLSSCSTSVG